MCNFSYANTENSHMERNEQRLGRNRWRQNIQEELQKQNIPCTSENAPEYISVLFGIEFLPPKELRKTLLTINPDMIIQQNSEQNTTERELEVNFPKIGVTEEQEKLIDLFLSSLETDNNNKDDNKFLRDLFMFFGIKIVSNITSENFLVSKLMQCTFDELYKILTKKNVNNNGDEIDYFLLKKSIMEAIKETLEDRFMKYFPLNDSVLNSLKDENNNTILVKTIYNAILLPLQEVVNKTMER